VTGLVAIYRRELAGLFVGPLAWILLSIALLLNGFLFTSYVNSLNGNVDEALRFLLGRAGPFWFLVVLFPPLITMRMISEESRSGLLEFLLTAPVTDAAVVTGKFLAALTFMGLLWASVFVYAFVAGQVGPPTNWGLVCAAWIGALLCSGLFCATGLFTSALTGVPLAAALSACVLNLALLLLPMLGTLSDAPWVRELLTRLDVYEHLRGSFLFGLFDTSYVLFFAAWTALFLFLAVRSVETRRWR